MKVRLGNLDLILEAARTHGRCEIEQGSSMIRVELREDESLKRISKFPMLNTVEMC